MTRAALVASVVAAAATASLPAAAAGPGQTRSTFVVRGVVVQYIPPSGSVVGSLSVRVVSTGDRGRALLGELVTVGVVHGKGLNVAKLPLRRSLWTITIRAASAQSILNGGAALQSIVTSNPGRGSSGGPASTSGPPQGSGGNSGGSGATSPAGHAGEGGPEQQSGGVGDGNGSGGGPGGDGSQGNGASDHGSGQPSDGGSGGAAHGSGQASVSGAGSSSGHK